MKIVAISDLHGYLPKLPKCDVVCICGDIFPLDIQKNIIKSISWFQVRFKPWAENLNCDKVIFIAGNHDFAMYELYKRFHVAWEVMEDLFLNETKISYLCDSFITYKDKVFYGSPWCPDLKNWAFYGNTKQLKYKFSLIYPNCDVLLTHCPPKIDQCGVVLEPDTFNYKHDYGCQELRDAIDYSKPKWCLCGHVHSGDHEITHYGDSNIVNVSIKDEHYDVVYEPFIFEI